MRYAAAFAFVAIALTTIARGKDEPLKGVLPEDFVVYSVRAHRDGNPLGIRLDDTAKTATQVEIVVNLPRKPVVLVLTAHDPVVWRVGHTEHTRIAGILVSGNHGQALIGVSKSTPHAISSLKGGGEFPSFYAPRESPVHPRFESSELRATRRSVFKLVGRDIDHFLHQPTDGVFYIGDKPAKKVAVAYSEDLKIEDYVDPDRPLVGQPALDELAKARKLRPASMVDIGAWLEASKNRGLLPTRDAVLFPLRVGKTYVVLEKVTLPDDLYGAHARAFIIPNDIPFPNGPRCHNSYYRMDGTVTGPLTRRR